MTEEGTLLRIVGIVALLIGLVVFLGYAESAYMARQGLCRTVVDMQNMSPRWEWRKCKEQTKTESTGR